ncbi:MAG TPA: hypothetical protein VLH75_13275 [Longimicrobiales bacterium]|nr:hypothetical protein [Longimicrobiales bacterium]
MTPPLEVMQNEDAALEFGQRIDHLAQSRTDLRSIRIQARIRRVSLFR